MDARQLAQALTPAGSWMPLCPACHELIGTIQLEGDEGYPDDATGVMGPRLRCPHCSRQVRLDEHTVWIHTQRANA